MPYFVVAEPHGVIRQVSHCDDEVWAMLQLMADPFRGGLAVAIPPPPADLTAYQATHYVADGVVVERTEMAPNVSTTSIAADGIAVATIAGLPNPCTLVVTGPLAQAATEITDGAVEFTADVAGDYTLSITATAFLPWSVVIHAT
jgi:hypothetical protein